MKDMQQFIASNGVPCLQMTSVGSHCVSGTEKETKQETNHTYSKKRLPLDGGIGGAMMEVKAIGRGRRKRKRTQLLDDLRKPLKILQ